MARIQRMVKLPAKARLPVRREIAAGSFDIRQFGAVADGATDCTSAIAAAIRACGQEGGGVVVIPRGKWASGPIQLLSNIHLHFQSDAEILFTPSPDAYLPAVPVRHNGLECFSYSPFLYALDCANVTVSGPGVIRPSGATWWDWRKHEPKSARKLSECAEKPRAQLCRLESPASGLRPAVIAAVRCRDVRIEEIRIAGAGPGTGVHVAMCERVSLREVEVASADGPDNVSLLIDASKAVSVEGGKIDAAGTGIRIEAEESRQLAGSITENVSIRNVQVRSKDCALLIKGDGGGTIRNVSIDQCDFGGSKSGICLAASRGRGGTVEDITIQNIDLGELSDDCIRLSAGSDGTVSRRGRGPDFRRIVLRDIACRKARIAVHLEGLPDQLLESIELHNVMIASEQGLFCGLASGVKLTNVRIKPVFGPSLSLKDSRHVTIDGMHQQGIHGIFLEVRGRQTREVTLRHSSRQKHRPSVVVGIDVPKDAIVHA